MLEFILDSGADNATCLSHRLSKTTIKAFIYDNISYSEFDLMNKSLGFTLSELLVTIAVLSILLSVAAPSFETLITNNRLIAQGTDLMSTLSFARSEAAKRATPVTVCRSTNGVQCTQNGTGWDIGWIVFVNELGDAEVVDESDLVLRVFSNLDGGNTLEGNSQVRDSITYMANGRANANGTFTLCDRRGPDHARAVIVSRNGRPRASTLDGSGNPLKCPAA